MLKTPWRNWYRKALGLVPARRRTRLSREIELLEVRVVPAVNLTVSTAASANVSAVTAAGTTTYTALNAGANINVADIKADLVAGNNVVIDNTAVGVEVGSITWDAAADLDVNGIVTPGSITINQDLAATGDIAINAQIFDSNTTVAEKVNLTVNAANALTLADTISAAAAVDVEAAGAIHLNGDITASTSVTAYAGTDGTGDLDFGTGVQVNADVQSYRAGDGVGGAATTAKVNAVTNGPIFSATNATATPTSISIRQDASITNLTSPALVQIMGNVLPATFSLTSDDGLVVDVDAPNTTVQANVAFAATNDVHLVVGGVDNMTVAANLTYQYRLDGGAWLATDATLDLLDVITDGPHTIQVRATDSSGNVDATVASFSWTADVTTPTLTVPSSQTVGVNLQLVLSGAAAISVNDVDAGSATQTVALTVNNGALTFGSTTGLIFLQGDGTADAAVTIRGSRAAVNAALGTLRYTSSVTGSDTLGLTVTDNGGLSSSTSVAINVISFAPDTIAPDTSFTLAAPVGNTGTGRFRFSGTDNLSVPGALTFQYSVDGSAFLAVNPNNGGLLDLSGLADGDHTLRVRAVDEAGNVDASAASFTWTANVTTPTITVPSTQTVAVNGSLTLSGNLALRVNDVDAGSATQRVALSVAHGTLTLATTAGLTFITGDGNADASIVFTGLRAAVNAALNGMIYTPALNFSGSEVVHAEVRDNGGLSSIAAFGIHVGALSDLVDPDTLFTLAGPVGNTGTAHFEFSGSDNITATEALHYQYKLDGGAFLDVNFANGGILDLAGLADGNHTLQIRAIDEAGNIDDTAASFSWTANVTAPSITFQTVLTQTVQTNANLFFNTANLNAIAISDNDAGSASQTVTLSVAHGTLSLASLSGLTILSGTGTNDTTVMFSGLRSAVNAALNGLKYVSSLNYTGSDSLQVNVADNGGLTAQRSLGISVLA